MKAEEILEKYNLDGETASQYILEKVAHNKQDTEGSTDLSYSTIQRYEKKFREMSREERSTLQAFLSINNMTKYRDER